jgi:plasmid stability protein
MPPIVLPDLKPSVMEKLKALALQHECSVEEEVRAIVEEAVQDEAVELLAGVLRIRQQLAGRKQTADSERIQQ